MFFFSMALELPNRYKNRKCQFSNVHSVMRDFILKIQAYILARLMHIS